MVYITGFAYPFEKVWPWGQPISMKIGLWVGLVVPWKNLEGKFEIQSIIDFSVKKLISDNTPLNSLKITESTFPTIFGIVEITGRSFIRIGQRLQCQKSIFNAF